MTIPEKIVATFDNPAQQRCLDDDGYVVLDLLDPGQIAQLRTLFDQLPHPVTRGFFATNEADDVAYKREMTTEIQHVVGDAVRRAIPRHRLIGGFFVVKWPDGDSEVTPHLDYSLVDERRFRSVSVWIPLVDTDSVNGALCCLRGSHRLVGSTHRGSPDFPTSADVARAVDRLGPDAVRQLDLRAGQAVVYSHQVIHCSAINRSGTPRPAVNIAAIPDQADLLHFRLRTDGRVDRLTVGDEYFESWEWNGSPPEPRTTDIVDRIDTLSAPVSAAVAQPGPTWRRRLLGRRPR